MDLLRQAVQLHSLTLIGYCLMSNHVHLVAIPHKPDSLANAFKLIRGRYASYWNAAHGKSGHGHPDRCQSACEIQPTGPNSPAAGVGGADGMANVITHELSESATDPDLDAWFDTSTGNENADLCNFTFGAHNLCGPGSLCTDTGNYYAADYNQTSAITTGCCRCSGRTPARAPASSTCDEQRFGSGHPGCSGGLTGSQLLLRDRIGGFVTPARDWYHCGSFPSAM